MPKIERKLKQDMYLSILQNELIKTINGTIPALFDVLLWLPQSSIVDSIEHVWALGK